MLGLKVFAKRTPLGAVRRSRLAHAKTRQHFPTMGRTNKEARLAFLLKRLPDSLARWLPCPDPESEYMAGLFENDLLSLCLATLPEAGPSAVWRGWSLAP